VLATISNGRQALATVITFWCAKRVKRFASASTPVALADKRGWRPIPVVQKGCHRAFLVFSHKRLSHEKLILTVALPIGKFSRERFASPHWFPQSWKWDTEGMLGTSWKSSTRQTKQEELSNLALALWPSLRRRRLRCHRKIVRRRPVAHWILNLISSCWDYVGSVL